jgi:glutaminase
MDIQGTIEKIYKKVKKLPITGKNADYIPQLKKVNPNLYAISVYMVDGREFDVGDYDKEVTIQSVSKVFSLALGLKTVGLAGMSKMIGTHQTFSEFNSIVAIEDSPNHTINSFENGGAMATTSVYYQKNQKAYVKKIFDNLGDFAGRNITYSKTTYESEMSKNDRNLAIAYLLKSHNRFYGDVIQCLSAYTKQCSAMVSTRDVALMGATLANYGINPHTNERVIDKKNIPYILTHMATNGMYGYSETWMTYIGMPAKSGVGGLILIVIPGVMGIGILSPPLDKVGNSVKGIITAKELSKELHLGVYDPDKVRLCKK